jgi:ferrous iron transport protein A
MEAIYAFTLWWMQVKKLSEIKVGKTVVIHSFEKDEIFIKLMEMGCVPGETVKVEQVAPLGDPISIAVSGYTLSLRLNEAEKILVTEL